MTLRLTAVMARERFSVVAVLLVRAALKSAVSGATIAPIAPIIGAGLTVEAVRHREALRALRERRASSAEASSTHRSHPDQADA